MFELFLFICGGGADYSCHVIPAETYQANMYRVLDEAEEDLSKRLYDATYPSVPFNDPSRKKCETHGAVLLAIDQVLDMENTDFDYVCIKKTDKNSLSKAQLHFKIEGSKNDG